MRDFFAGRHVILSGLEEISSNKLSLANICLGLLSFSTSANILLRGNGMMGFRIELMASNKERQAKYRAGRATAGPNGDGERRLECWISSEAHFALARLARHRSLTKRSLIETLLIKEDGEILRGLADNEQHEAYLGEAVNSGGASADT